MKRYEKPMVELTKFNAEDIIATSGEFSTTDAANAAVVQSAIDNGTLKATDGGVYDGRQTFNW